MNLKSRRFGKRFNGCLLAAACVLAAERGLGGQPVLMAPPPIPTQPVAVQEDSTNDEMSVFTPSYDSRDGSLAQPFKFGSVLFRPHPYYHFLYDSGIKSGTNNSQRSIVQELSPGIAVDLGRHWTADYTPTFRFYSNRAFRNSVDHSANLSGSTRYEDWLFNVSQSFVKSDSTLVETATQTRQETYDTEFKASRVLNDHFSEETDLSQLFNFVSGIQNSRNWSGLESLNYEFNKRLITGISVGGGYVKIESDSTAPSSPDQSYENVNALLRWRATDKLGFNLNAGIEDRQTLATGYGAELNPTFGAEIDYAPFKQTQITLTAGRKVSSSDYTILAQSTEDTSVSLSVSQRLLGKYNLTLTAGYDQTDYTTTLGPLASVRTDNDYTFSARLGRSFLKRGNVGVTYQYSYNQSTMAGFGYRSNQIGFEVGFAY